MVYLTMTPAIVQALNAIQATGQSTQAEGDHESDKCSIRSDTSGNQSIESEDDTSTHSKQCAKKEGSNVIVSRDEPSLQSPEVGNPISHGQVIDLSRQLKAQNVKSTTLDTLLRGSRIYIAPPPPRPEPSSEYKALMARLRRDEEARSYERMTNPPLPMETFSQRFPMSSAAHAFGPVSNTDPFAETDEVTYADVDRQMALVLNILVSIIACAGGIWMVARWWSTPARLALSLSGSLLVGIAEVVVYLGYVRRIGESKSKEKGTKEVKEIVKSWVLDGNGTSGGISIERSEKLKGPRRRQVKAS